MSNRLKLISFWLLIFLITSPAYALDTERLPDDDIKMVKQVIAKLQPLIQSKEADSSIPTLTFDELYTPLDKPEQKFLKKFEKLNGKKLGVIIPWRGLSTDVKPFVAIRKQKVKEKKKITEKGIAKEVMEERTLPVQFLPRPVYKKYVAMMDAMEADIGKRLYLESGYRSSAFQLYLFVYYLQNHNYSIRETVKFVALPGYSEHGDPFHQALDFINENGINGDPDVKSFEELPENLWLLKNAHRFGFVLSYPKTGIKGITYEPWHWRYNPETALRVAQAEHKKDQKPS